VNRALYMDEQTLAPHAGFDRLSRDLASLVESLLDLFADPAEAAREAAE
jgi:N-formylglutamate amidohydrolase